MASPVTPVVPAKVSWLKRVGHFLGVVLGVVAKDGKPILDTALKVAKAVLPGDAALIDAAGNIADHILTEIIAAETMEQAGAAAQGGAAKLDAVLQSSGPAIDNWVQSKWPGADKLSAAAKAGLISALVDLVNEVTTPVVVVTPVNVAAAPKS